VIFMQGSLLDLAATQGGVFHRRQALDAGVTPRQLDGDFERQRMREVRPGVFVIRGAPPSWKQRAWIELLDAPEGAILGERTAASMHRIGQIVTSDIDVLEIEPTWHRVRDLHRRRTTFVPSEHRTTVDGLPVTTVARTLFDLCGMVSQARRARDLPNLTKREVERAMDDAIARSTSVASLEQVLARLGGRGRGGTALFRELLDARGEGFVATESELEDLLLAVLARFGLPLPSKQVVIGGDLPVGRVDFLYREHRIVIEADSRKHHSSLRDAERDRWRDIELAAAGFVVIRVTWRQLIDEPARFVQALEQLLARSA
jgi:hypothetical protein